MASSSTNSTAAAGLRSQERFLDADEIESSLLPHITRPSAKLHLENLIMKLRKEGKALQRVEESTAKANDSSSAAATDDNNDSSTMELEEVDGPSTTATPAPATTKTTSTASASNISSSQPTSTKKYHPFPSLLFDAGQYNSPYITVYLPLPNIGQHDPAKISVNFTSSSFDIIVSDYNGKSYRCVNNNLEKDINVSECKYILKPNKILLKLGKVKGEYGSYDTWTQLSSKKDKSSRNSSNKDSSNPAAGIMDLMKDMYDEGDDNMKKMIGETMYKQRMGQLNNGKDDLMGGMGGMGGFGGMGDMMDM
ncbi:hypothetical protein ACHAWU_005222 [Discostella pseudostelligera]|uniref:CS domain-containing protein n=1 Tax=Discostella pseudostelligera TaxID=259834 RepID=A0ABD3M7C2_9STRA